MSIQLLKAELFSTGFSFIGRVLVVNSPCASTLWYILSVLQPQQDYIRCSLVLYSNVFMRLH